MGQYPPDPGGNFASDVHRRVVSAIPSQDQQDEPATVGKHPSGKKIKGVAKSLEAILFYVRNDEDNAINGTQVATTEVPGEGEESVVISRREITEPASEEAVLSVISELVEDGDVQELKDGYKLTSQGAKVAAGENADNGGRNYHE